jgi:hypothetical protein
MRICIVSVGSRIGIKIECCIDSCNVVSRPILVITILTYGQLHRVYQRRYTVHPRLNLQCVVPAQEPIKSGQTQADPLTEAACSDDPGLFELRSLKPLATFPPSTSFELSEGPVGFRITLTAGNEGLPFRSSLCLNFPLPLSLTLLPLPSSPPKIRSRAAW